MLSPMLLTLNLSNRLACDGHVVRLGCGGGAKWRYANAGSHFTSIECVICIGDLPSASAELIGENAGTMPAGSGSVN
jgi:hypothetical protein